MRAASGTTLHPGKNTAGPGSDHLWEVAPFFNVGFQTGRVELVAYSVFGIPTNQDATDEFETEFSYDISSLIHVSSRFQGLFEINGHTVLSGDEAGHGLVSVSPAVKFAPLTTSSLFVGVGVSIPLGRDELDARLRTSVFYHF